MELLKKRGPKINMEINNKIIEIIKELKVVTPEMVRLAYKERYNKGIGWNTVDRRLKGMTEKKVVIQKILNTGIRRTTAVYSLT